MTMIKRADAKNAKPGTIGLLNEEIEWRAYEIIGAANEVHTILGSGYLESIYEEAILLLNFNVPVMKEGIRRGILSQLIRLRTLRLRG